MEDLDRIPEWAQPYTANWKEALKDYVWYVSYGSNMFRERFMHYIEGGQFEGGGAYNEACRDTSAPAAVKPYDIPYNMYFRNRSGSWGGNGVSFLDCAKAGHALGTAYANYQNWRGHDWYNEVVSLAKSYLPCRSNSRIRARTISITQKNPGFFGR